MNAEFYKLGCEMALRVCGLDKAATGDLPVYQGSNWREGMNSTRRADITSGNKYVKPYPQQAQAQAAPAVKPALPPKDFSADASVPFQGVGGTKAPIDYSALSGAKSYR